MVRATFAGYSTALSAMQANQKRLDIVGQNISNMNTVGYTRQQLDTASLNYTNPTSSFNNSGSSLNVGFGVSMTGISQIRDPYLDVQYRDQIAKSTYHDKMQSSLDSLSQILDESNISGIRQAFDDIQSTLTNMQDPAKINNPIYESELQVRMQALTNLLNDAARQIQSSEVSEFQHLDGTGTSENGAIQEVNDILAQIGDLNHQIKRNQIGGQESLELLDKRNVLLDELASYIPIDVSYYNEGKFDNWPDDLKVDMLYKTEEGVTQRLTLIDGTKGSQGNNYGSLSIPTDADGNPLYTAQNPTEVQITFTAASGEQNTADSITVTAGDSAFSSGSMQASLDMLGKKCAGGNDTIRGYQYYMEQLDTLAKTFADKMNEINSKNSVSGTDYIIRYDIGNNGTDDQTSGTSDATGAALSIGLTSDWLSGNVHLSTAGNNATDTIVEMLGGMTETWDELNNNSFTDFINHVSTILANDSNGNTTALETNVTVLNSIQDSKDSLSAVSLDEEAANMMAYLSAYNAASRLMTALDEALNTLINGTGLVGR